MAFLIASSKSFEIENIYNACGTEFDACDDESVWNLISSNKTTGLFQIGTDTYKKRMPRLKTKSIDELAACLALVRGPCISAGSDETYMRILENKELTICL